MVGKKYIFASSSVALHVTFSAFLSQFGHAAQGMYSYALFSLVLDCIAVLYYQNVEMWFDLSLSGGGVCRYLEGLHLSVSEGEAGGSHCVLRQSSPF